MGSFLDHGVVQFGALPEGVRNVAVRLGSLDEGLELRSGRAGADFNGDPLKARPRVLSPNPYVQVRQLDPLLARHVGNRHGETRGERREQEFGRHGSGIRASVLRRLIRPELELAHRHSAPIAAFPVGGNFHRDGV